MAFDVVGVTGDAVSLMGEVGESRSREPAESFVRFFLRNPRVGIDAVGGKECYPALAWPGGVGGRASAVFGGPLGAGGNSVSGLECAVKQVSQAQSGV